LLLLTIGCTKADLGPQDGAAGSGGGGDLGGEIGSGGSSAAGGSGGEVLPDGSAGADGGPVDMEIDAVFPMDTADDGDAMMAADSDGSVVDGDASNGETIDAGGSITPTLAGQLLVSELLFDAAAVADDYGEWFEIYNPSADATYNLLGCAILDGGQNMHIINRVVLVPPGSYRTFALSAPGGLPTTDPGFIPDYVYAGIKFGNDHPDAVMIRCGGAVIDRFDYVAPTAGQAGHSQSVDPVHLKPGENNVAGNYCKSQVEYHSYGGGTDYGTPGRENPPCPAGR
jgi:hypothetical protein